MSWLGQPPRKRGKPLPRTPEAQVEQMRNLLAFLLVGAFISCLPVFTLKVIPPENKDIITYMVGQLSGMATMALGFYFVNKVGADAREARQIEVDAKKADNTSKMAEAVIAAATGKDPTGGPAVGAEAVADAAVERADEIKGGAK